MSVNLKLKSISIFNLSLMTFFLIILSGCDKLYYAEIENTMDDPVQIIVTGQQFSETQEMMVLDTIRMDKISYQMEGQSTYFFMETINRKIALEHIPFDSLLIIVNQDTLFLNSPQEILDQMEENRGNRILKISAL